MTEINKDVIDTDIHDCETPTKENSESPPTKDLCTGDINPCPTIIRVLVLLPQATTNEILKSANNNPFVAALIRILGFEAINVTLKNSGITSKELKFTFDKTTFTTNAQDLQGAMTAVEKDLNILQLREKHKADLVHLLLTKDFTGGAGIASGYSTNNPSSSAFGFTELRWFLSPRWTAVHEIGHNLRAQHSRDEPVDPAKEGCEHGWFITDDQNTETIMASWAPGRTRQLHYSNPNISFGGLPTGTNDDFNASAISNAACSVGKYRIGCDDGLLASIEGRDFVCIFEDILKYETFTAFSEDNCDMNGIQYEWRTNTTGIFNVNNKVISTSKFISFNSGILGNNFLFLTTTTAAGASSTASKMVNVRKCGPSHSKVSLQNNSNQINISTIDGIATIKLSKIANEVEYQVSDINGRIITRKVVRSYENNPIDINLDDYKSGIYFITVWNGTEVLSKKIFINN